MGNLKVLAKLAPVLVISSVVIAFANSTATAAREAGYVPIVVTTTGSTGGQSGLVGSSGPGGGHGSGHHHHHKPHHPAKRRAHAQLEKTESVYALHISPSVQDNRPPHDPGTDDGPAYYLNTGKKYEFDVRWHTTDDSTNPPTPLSMPTITWTAALFNDKGKQVTASISTVIDLSDSPDKHDHTYEEKGTITLLDDGIYSEDENYYVRLVAYVQHTEANGAHHADEKSSPHNSVRLYWAQSSSPQ